MLPKDKISKPIILSVIFGLLASLVGSFAILSFVLPADFWLGSSNISTSNQELLKASLGVKTYGTLEVYQFLNNALPAAAGIYKKKPAGTQFSDSSLYVDKDRIGSGFTLTSDGWIVTDKAVLDSLGAKNAKSLLAVLVKGKIYGVENIIYDTWTNVAFLKINAVNLPVAAFGDSDAMHLGDLVFGGIDKNNFWTSFVSGINFYPDGAKTMVSENFGKRIRLQDRQAALADGGLVANKNGEIIGIMMSEVKGYFVLPANYFKNIVPNILKSQKAARPYLGVKYIDLNAAIAENLPAGSGALVRSVVAGSPAAKAGIKAGDIIIGVDDAGFNEGKNLSEIIFEYKPGDGVNLKVLRNGADVNINIALGTL